MAQESGPISQGTTAERQFTDVRWRDIFGDESGVIGDTDGTAYKYSLSTNSDVVSIGSSTIRSTARVAGFGHAIPVGSPEGITIPAASGSARTDIIALRYDPAFTGLPGPVRLTRIAGTSSSLPAYDAAPPGVEDLPLWSITRQPGQALSQATVKRMYTRIAPALDVAPTVPLPSSSPLGTEVRYVDQQWRRELDSNGVPVWRPLASSVVRSRFQIATATGTLAGAVDIAPAMSFPATPLGAGIPYVMSVSARIRCTLPQGTGARLELLLNDSVFALTEQSQSGVQATALATLEINDIAYVTGSGAQTIRARLTSLGSQITVNPAFGRVYVQLQPYSAI